MQIIFMDKNSILYTQEKSEVLENTKCYKNTEVAELFCVVPKLFWEMGVTARKQYFLLTNKMFLAS